MLIVFSESRLVQDVLSSLPKDLPAEATAYIKKMCDHTCQGILSTEFGILRIFTWLFQVER